MAAEYEIVEGLHAVNAMLHDARARGGIDGVEEAAGRRHLKNAAATIVALAEALQKARVQIITNHPLASVVIQIDSALARLKGDSHAG